MYLHVYIYPATSLGVSDLSRVREELLDVSHKWFDIGLKLKLSVGTLECVRDQYPNPSTALREMLHLWLKKVDPPPTWEGLACALESRTVREPQLSEQLRTKYCKTEGAAGQLLYTTKTMRSFLVTRVINLNCPDCFKHVCKLQSKMTSDSIQKLSIFVAMIAWVIFQPCVATPLQKNGFERLPEF